MEEALVFISIVLGIAIAFELEHLNTLIQSKNVKWHWAQPLFALFILLTIMSFWWLMASASIDEKITLAQFLPIMWVLVLLNLLAAVSLPDHVPEEGLDLAEYYQEQRRYMWGLYFLVVLPLALNWVYQGYLRSQNFADVVPYLTSELLPLALVVFMFFARKWWLVGLGFAALGFVVVGAWLVRAI